MTIQVTKSMRFPIASVRSWISPTPFAKQCFVVFGVSLSICQVSLVIGFIICFLPQIKEDPGFSVDDETGSWLASLPGITQIMGNILIPTLMGTLGRRKANIISTTVVTISWVMLVAGTSVTVLMIARFLQGISSGINFCLVPIAIGEYSSPKNRGVFSLFMSLLLGIMTFLVQTLGSYLTWRQVAVFGAVVSVVNLVMVVMSPETPSWLADHGRYEECRRVFRWLRGDGEEDEVDKMIEANRLYKDSREGSQNFSTKLKNCFEILKDKAFYIPIIITGHLFIMGQFAGMCMMTSYLPYIVHSIIGKDVDTAAVVVSAAAQRLVCGVVAILIIKRTKRRTMLLFAVISNIAVMLATAAYVFAKQNYALPYDHPVIGGILIHLLMITISIGSMPIPLTISGEIFPIRYRSLAGGISFIFMSLSIFLIVKTFLFMLSSIGLAWGYCAYAAVTGYCLGVAWLLLPETKDRTLQDIEEEFKRL